MHTCGSSAMDQTTTTHIYAGKQVQTTQPPLIRVISAMRVMRVTREMREMRVGTVISVSTCLM